MTGEMNNLAGTAKMLLHERDLKVAELSRNCAAKGLGDVSSEQFAPRHSLRSCAAGRYGSRTPQASAARTRLRLVNAGGICSPRRLNRNQTPAHG